jgi:hypothetical protein
MAVTLKGARKTNGRECIRTTGLKVVRDGFSFFLNRSS